MLFVLDFLFVCFSLKYDSLSIKPSIFRLKSWIHEIVQLWSELLQVKPLTLQLMFLINHFTFEISIIINNRLMYFILILSGYLGLKWFSLSHWNNWKRKKIKSNNNNIKTSNIDDLVTYWLQWSVWFHFQIWSYCNFQTSHSVKVHDTNWAVKLTFHILIEWWLLSLLLMLLSYCYHTDVQGLLIKYLASIKKKRAEHFGITSLMF